jgi:dienelactone hydrolase
MLFVIFVVSFFLVLITFTSGYQSHLPFVRSFHRPTNNLIMAAASGSCCPPTAWPALSAPEDYEPKGTEDKLDDLSIYVVGEPGAKAVIVLPEVFGWAGRMKGICDTLADEGFFVVMPDCHRGTTAADQPDFVAWVNQYNWDSHIAGDFTKLMAYLESKGATAVGSIGFCWGVWAFCKASSQGVALKCGVGCHPSTRLEGMFGGNEVDMISATNMPSLFLSASDDPETLKEGGEIAGILASKGGSVDTYPDMKHGFVSRGDLSDANVKRDVEDALNKAIAFLKQNVV